MIETDCKSYEKAKELLCLKDYDEAFKIFDILNCKYECGFIKLAKGQIKEAEKLWKQCKDQSPAVNWGLSLVSLLNLTVPKGLTFFQIRNFLERDLKLLIDNKHLQLAENLISASDILAEYNPESYKFIGRVLLQSGYVGQSFEFLEKSREICYSDPEIYFLLADYYVKSNDISSAIKTLKKSIKMNPAYFPSKNMLEHLSKL